MRLPTLSTLLACVALTSACATNPDDTGPRSGGKGDDLGGATCSSLIDPLFADLLDGDPTSAKLEEFATATRELTLEDERSLATLESEQIVRAMRELRQIPADGDLSDAFAAADGQTFFALMLELGVPGESNYLQADWIDWTAGDNEFGVVFEAGTTRPLAIVNDGDVFGCE